MTNSTRVLIIEDHKDIAEMLYDYFERRDYELDYASDGRMGFNLASQNEYDIIFAGPDVAGNGRPGCLS